MDWKSLIAEIQRHGYTQPQIAAVCGCGQATISDLALGNTKEPRHSLGEALRRLRDEAGAVDAPLPPQWDGKERRTPERKAA
jgi:transcriptional regulator with XRE-family HTH domain